MRPLAVLVLAMFLVILVLVALWLGGAAAAADHPLVPRFEPEAAAATPVVGVLPETAAPEEFERRPAELLAAQVTAGEPAGIVVAGTVRSADGTPVVGAHLLFRRQDERRTGKTEALGTYATPGLQAGEWQLLCAADGFVRHETQVTLDQRATQQCDIELRPAYVVKVKFQNAAGEFLHDLLMKKAGRCELGVVATEQPLAGDLPVTERAMYVRFGAGEWRTNSGSHHNQDPKLREQGFAGELHLDRDPPVHAALVLRHLVLQRQRIEPGQRELVFTIEVDDVVGLSSSVVMRLLDDSTGAPMANTRVGIGSESFFMGQTDADGFFTIKRTPPGLLNLWIWTKDYETVFRYVRMLRGGNVDLGEIRLSRPMVITVMAVNAEGKPVTDAKFQCTNLDDRAFPQELNTRMSMVLDDSGKGKLGLGRHRYVVCFESRSEGFGHVVVDAINGPPAPVIVTIRKRVNIGIRPRVDTTVGYMVTILDRERAPVRALWLGGENRPDGTSLPAGDYTVEIHDGDDRLVRSFALTVGSEPLTIDVP